MFNRTTLALASFSALCLSASIANADVLANWTFETSTPTTAGPFAAEAGLYAPTSFASGSHASGSAAYSSPAGNGSAHSFSSNFWAIGDYYQFTTSTAGYQNILITWDQTGSNTGPRDFSLQYSTDGTNFTDVMSYQVINGSWSSGTPVTTTSYSFDFSAIAALNDLSTIYLRFTVESNVSVNGGTIATGGTDRVDNVVILGDAVPAPGALALLGLAGAVVGSRRRR